MEKQQGPAAPNTDNDDKKQTSHCEECNLNTSKYRCPGCSIRSCSLPCVKSHKQRTGCTGKRPRTQVIPISQFDDNLLISDYNFLEEAKGAAESAQRIRDGKFGSFPFKLPFKLKMLRNAAGRRSTRLLLLPKGMSKRERNQSRYDQKKNSIFWTIEWRFHSTDVILIDHGVGENTNLSSIIGKHLQPGPWNNQLRPFCENLDHLRFFIRKNPMGPKSPFNELDIKAPLGQQLARTVIIEYPVVHVFLPSDSFDFEITKCANVIPQKSEHCLTPMDEQPSPKGVLFREEEIVEDDMCDAQILDLMEFVNPEPLDSLQAVDRKTDRQIISSDVQLAGVSQDITTWSKNESQIGRAENKDLKDVYSGLIEQANPDGFLDLEGGSINEGFLDEIRESLGFSGVFNAGNSSFHPEFSPCTVRTIGVFHHLRAWNCNRMLKQGKFRSKRICRALNLGPDPSFDDLEFYIDIWDVPVNEERLVFSEVFPGSVLGGGMKDLLPHNAEMHLSYLDGSGYKMFIPVEPKFSFIHETVRVSVLVGRRDTNKLACIFDKWEFLIDKNDEEKEVLAEWVPASVLRGGIKELPPPDVETDDDVESDDDCETDDDCEMDRSVLGRPGCRYIIPIEPKFSILNETVIVSPPGVQWGTYDMVCIFRKSEFDHFASGLTPLGYDIWRYPDISQVRAWVTLYSMEDRWIEDWDYFVAGIALDFSDVAIDENGFLALLDWMLDWD
ncbi:hypothetical protein NE237_021428 [Protea cynaroides]|uniref:Box C/D snoRNA protein 1 n=1 Tax=Protea cynaroides TaxID=273540 RepID=A0A9Q0K4V7_9MAGN|nr:hypothetical protein NE237_021428 [Protea cynaroides]